MSFVQSPEDVQCLRKELERLGRPDLGIILKIETAHAFASMPSLLWAAMEHERVGVMIARGDLAVECGYQRLAEVQEELLWICEAAHLPAVWATQVLEGLAKTGVPSRAEVTDAAMGERAECVMLNKGPHILDAVSVLDDILRRMEEHQSKKTAQLRALKSWQVKPATRPPGTSIALGEGKGGEIPRVPQGSGFVRSETTADDEDMRSGQPPGQRPLQDEVAVG